MCPTSWTGTNIMYFVRKAFTSANFSVSYQELELFNYKFLLFSCPYSNHKYFYFQGGMKLSFLSTEYEFNLEFITIFYIILFLTAFLFIQITVTLFYAMLSI